MGKHNQEIETLSNVLAKRLKELRESYLYTGANGKPRHLSHNALEEKLGNAISAAALKSYEAPTMHSSKAYSNIGMSVKSLYTLATFFNVSADYLLGISHISAIDTDEQIAQETLGISNAAVKNMISTAAGTKSAERGMDALLSHERMPTMMLFIQETLNKVDSYKREAAKNPRLPQSYRKHTEELINGKLYLAVRAFENIMEDIIKTELDKAISTAKEAADAEEE